MQSWIKAYNLSWPAIVQGLCILVLDVHAYCPILYYINLFNTFLMHGMLGNTHYMEQRNSIKLFLYRPDTELCTSYCMQSQSNETLK